MNFHICAYIRAPESVMVAAVSLCRERDARTLPCTRRRDRADRRREAVAAPCREAGTPAPTSQPLRCHAHRGWRGGEPEMQGPCLPGAPREGEAPHSTKRCCGRRRKGHGRRSPSSSTGLGGERVPGKKEQVWPRRRWQVGPSGQVEHACKAQPAQSARRRAVSPAGGGSSPRGWGIRGPRCTPLWVGEPPGVMGPP